MSSRAREVLEVAGVSAYLIGAGALLRLTGRVRPAVSLPRLVARALRLAVARRVGGPTRGAIATVRHAGGHAYLAALPLLLAEPSDEEAFSRLGLLEDGRPLGPAHSAHELVVRRGAGAFSHWGRHVVFSSSDGSDPRSNGRRYEWAIGD